MILECPFRGLHRVGYTCYDQHGPLYGGSSSFSSKIEIEIPDSVVAVFTIVMDSTNTITSAHLWENNKWKMVELDEMDKLIERLSKPKKQLPPKKLDMNKYPFTMTNG